MTKLYRVRATMDVLVVSTDSDTACRTARAQGLDELQATAVLAGPDDMPAGWTPKTLVYQSDYHAADLTVGEALGKKA